MSDGVIKLFGKRISLQPVEEEKVPNAPNCKSHELKNETKNLQKDLDDSANLSTPVQPENTESALTNKEGEEDSNDTSSENSKEGDDKSSLKKPDKILPCPRCHSMDTKFCYFNNYNVNQPRHFCKNCQRYWTAGGSMRNVPVGAGRRKSKSNPSSLPGSHFYGTLPVPNTLLQPLQSNSLGSKVNGSATVLSFGSDPNPPLNGFRLMENGDENSTISSVEVSKPKDGENKMDTMNTGAASTNGTTPWPYAWGPVPAMYNGSGIGVQIYPYWGCIPLMNGAWTIPCTGGAYTGPVMLGKHSRDGSTLNSEARTDGTKDNKIWVPKTLRIDNPEEAAKSSMWAMVAAHNEKADKIGCQITKMFEPKGEVKESLLKKPHMLIANPAALARSVNFHENA